MAAPECAFPYRSQAGAWRGARGVWAAGTGLGGWVCPAFQPRHVPHAASVCVCPEGLVVSPDLLAAGGCSKLLPVVVVVEEFLERAGKMECPCPGWLVQSSVCLILTEQCPECHPASHEGTGCRGAGDHPADGGKEAPGLPEEGAAGGVTTPIPNPTSLEPPPRGAVLPTHRWLQPKTRCSLLWFPCEGMGWDAPSPEIPCSCSRL